MAKRKSTRHPNFDRLVEKLEAQVPRAREAIEGAIWEIERQPRSFGIRIPDLDVWQSRLLLPPNNVEILLMYCVDAKNRVQFLTILAGSDSELDLSL
jgi:hypothetical protein